MWSISRKQARGIIASKVLVLAITAAGCSQPKPVVVLDGWLSADLLTAACEIAKRSHDTERITSVCVLGQSSLSNFENEIATQFAADPRCNGVRLGSWGQI